MRQSTRLIVNSLAMFSRMALSIVISLLATRLLLRTVGKIDFGLILALGATGGILQFVTSALTPSVQRQLTAEIARDDKRALSSVFSTAWVIYMSLGTILWLIGALITPLVLHVLTIPPDRYNAAWWVYQISLINLLLVVTATPYQALMVAHQNLTIKSLADISISAMRLAAVALLWFVPWDLMIAFAAIQLAGFAIVRWLLNAYCLSQYPESWPRPRTFDRAQLRPIVSIGLWSLLSHLGFKLRMDGGTLLINVFFGPLVNAGYGVATQLAGYAASLSSAIQQTVLPAIVGAHVKGNRESFQRLALVAGKYIVLLLCFVYVPLMFEAEQALRLWLGELPNYSVIFTRLVLIWPLVNLFTHGYSLANVATGDLSWYTKRLLLSGVLILAVAGAGFYLGMAPWFLPVVAIVGSVIMMFVAVYGLGALIDLPPSRWFREALLPTLGVLVPGCAAAGAVYFAFPPTIWRALGVGAVYALVTAPLIWIVGLAPWERERFRAFFSSALGRLYRPGQMRTRP